MSVSITFLGDKLTEAQKESLSEKISVLRLKEPVSVEFAEKIDDCRCSSLWYGGTIANIFYRGWRFELTANGDVRASLIRKVDDVELFRIKDKHNGGDFGQELLRYIKTDEGLYAAENGEHPEYTLELDDNNWFECFAFDSDGKYYDLMWALDADNVFESVVDVIDGMDEIIEGEIREKNDGDEAIEYS